MLNIADSLAERDEFEPSDDLVSIAGVSVCTGVAFTVGRPRADWEVRDLIRQMSATNPRVQIFRGARRGPCRPGPPFHAICCSAPGRPTRARPDWPLPARIPGSGWRNAIGLPAQIR